tara:strand:- start:43 stop:399 length:357 start_codon:yes stop_codon:yes gene_type:complete
MSSYGTDAHCKKITCSGTVTCAKAVTDTSTVDTLVCGSASIVGLLNADAVTGRAVVANEEMRTPQFGTFSGKPANPFAGQLCFVITEAAAGNVDDNTLQVYNGTAWVKVTTAALGGAA